MAAPLREPLLSGEATEEAVASAGRPAAARKAPIVPWIEFTDSNGRGRAAITSFIMGVSCSLTPVLLLVLPSTGPFAVYFALLVCFHMLEYLLTAAFRPDTLSFDNFLLNHSVLYQAMVAMCWAEYWLEWALFPRLGWAELGHAKQWGTLNCLGVIVCLVGLVTRSLGMATASTNFSHKIEDQKRPGHQLVTHGIYAYLRHPAYFGFFWFSVGSQLLLANPFCLVAYTGSSWYFFYDRIAYEEGLLVEFFGDTYREYTRKTAIGIPLLEMAIGRLP